MHSLLSAYKLSVVAVAERLSESAHIMDHDPSLALYRLQVRFKSVMKICATKKLEKITGRRDAAEVQVAN